MADTSTEVSTSEVIATGSTQLDLETLIELTNEQNELLTEQNSQLAELTQILWWIFFILAFYGIYKIFLSNLLSWFNGS